MKVQRIQVARPNNGDLVNGDPKISWMVIGDDWLPVKPVREYLIYLETAERSPDTVRAYAYHLMLLFQFLRYKNLDWKAVKFNDLVEFITWLRFPPTAPTSSQVVVDFRRADKPSRCEKTVNTIIAAVGAFYEYQARLGNVEPPVVHEWRQPYGNQSYKPLLHHISKNHPQKRSLLKLKAPKTHPPTLTADEVARLVAACRRLRDRFLICLLSETGMRIGQALGLRHSDIRSFDNLIKIVPRADNVNGARAKTDTEYHIHVSPELMKLYADYLIHEFGEIESDYVFVNLWDGQIGRPMSYGAAKDLFNRLKRRTGIDARPHKFRHTHATELLRDGWDSSFVQKRLGHKSIMTTINIYSHISQEDLKIAHADYVIRRKEREKERQENIKPQENDK